MNRTAARANAARRGLARALALYDDRLTLIDSPSLDRDRDRAQQLVLRIRHELDRRGRAGAAAAADWGQP